MENCIGPCEHRQVILFTIAIDIATKFNIGAEIV